MGKPLGVGLGLTEGGPFLAVHTPTIAEDAIWNAVTESINEGWTADRLINEVESAWRELWQQEAKDRSQDMQDRVRRASRG